MSVKTFSPDKEQVKVFMLVVIGEDGGQMKVSDWSKNYANHLVTSLIDRSDQKWSNQNGMIDRCERTNENGESTFWEGHWLERLIKNFFDSAKKQCKKGTRDMGRNGIFFKKIKHGFKTKKCFIVFFLSYIIPLLLLLLLFFLFLAVTPLFFFFLPPCRTRLQFLL